jgi:hypothetical protein
MPQSDSLDETKEKYKPADPLVSPRFSGIKTFMRLPHLTTVKKELELQLSEKFQLYYVITTQLSALARLNISKASIMVISQSSLDTLKLPIKKSKKAYIQSSMPV